MSLSTPRHPQTDGIKDQSLVWQPDGKYVPRAYAILTIAGCIGMPIITEENYPLFYERYQIYERLVSPIWNGPEITMYHIWQMVGLRAFAVPLTDVQFKNHVWKLMKLDTVKERDALHSIVLDEIARQRGEPRSFAPGKLTEMPFPGRVNQHLMTTRGKQVYADQYGESDLSTLNSGTFTPSEDDDDRQS